MTRMFKLALARELTKLADTPDLAYDRDNRHGNVGEAYRVHVRAGELELERGPQGAAQRHG